MGGICWPNQARAHSGTWVQPSFYNKNNPSRHGRRDEKGEYPEELEWGRSHMDPRGLVLPQGLGLLQFPQAILKWATRWLMDPLILKDFPIVCLLLSQSNCQGTYKYFLLNLYEIGCRIWCTIEEYLSTGLCITATAKSGKSPLLQSSAPPFQFLLC